MTTTAEIVHAVQTASRRKRKTSKPQETFTIANIAGGDERTFRWTGEISGVAIRHADHIGFGGPMFGGEYGESASAAYDRVLEDRLYAEGY